MDALNRGVLVEGVARKDGPPVRLVSRKGVDHTTRYPDLAAAIALLKSKTLVLDGERAVFGISGRAAGHARRVRLRRASARRAGGDHAAEGEMYPPKAAGKLSTPGPHIDEILGTPLSSDRAAVAPLRRAGVIA